MRVKGAADWTRFLEKNGRFAGTRYEAGVLCTSKKGAKVPMARFGCLKGEPKYKVFMTSRHHCSETMATFVLEGVAAAFLADDELGEASFGMVRDVVLTGCDFLR